jgi:hypothetical protein
MTSGLKITKDRVPEVMAALKALVKDRVLIGIPSEKAFRAPDADDPHPEINNAEIGYLNEFGVPEMNIPARPHLVPGIKKALPQIEKIYRAAAIKVLDGDIRAVGQAETRVGSAATSAVKNMISDVLPPPLSERTLEERRRRGVTRTTPLQDTGQYRNNIDFVVRPAKNVKVLGK